MTDNNQLWLTDQLWPILTDCNDRDQFTTADWLEVTVTNHAGVASATTKDSEHNWLNITHHSLYRSRSLELQTFPTQYVCVSVSASSSSVLHHVIFICQHIVDLWPQLFSTKPFHVRGWDWFGPNIPVNSVAMETTSGFQWMFCRWMFFRHQHSTNGC